MDSLRWDDLRAFLAVARTGTLAEGAAALEVNASTVHRRVAALEAALSADLFERTPRGYALTHLGEALLPHAEEVEAAVSGLRRTASGHDRTAQGPVILTLPESLVTVIAPCLAAVRAACPGLRPILRADSRLLDLGSEADLALRPDNNPPASAVGRRVGRIAWAIYGPPASVGDPPWVLYGADGGPSAARRWQAGLATTAPVLVEVSSVGAMQRMLTNSPTRGLLPCYLGDPDPGLTRRSPPIDSMTTDLWLLIHADLRRSARVRALVDLLVPQVEDAAALLAGEAG